MEVRSERKGNNYGADLVGGLGTLSQGISKCDREGFAEKLTPLTNKFSALHDMKMGKAEKMGRKDD